MTFSACVIATAVFLSVMMTVVFTALVIGIHKGDRARHLSDPPAAALDAMTHRLLGVGARRSHNEEP